MDGEDNDDDNDDAVNDDDDEEEQGKWAKIAKRRRLYRAVLRRGRLFNAASRFRQRTHVRGWNSRGVSIITEGHMFRDTISASYRIVGSRTAQKLSHGVPSSDPQWRISAYGVGLQ